MITTRIRAGLVIASLYSLRLGCIARGPSNAKGLMFLAHVSRSWHLWSCIYTLKKRKKKQWSKNNALDRYRFYIQVRHSTTSTQWLRHHPWPSFNVASTLLAVGNKLNLHVFSVAFEHATIFQRTVRHPWQHFYLNKYLIILNITIWWSYIDGSLVASNTFFFLFLRKIDM